MMKFEPLLKSGIADALSSLYGIKAAPESIVLQETRKEFAGDFTLVVFPYAKQAGKPPDETGHEIGKHLLGSNPLISSYNVVKGFLNLVISGDHWKMFFNSIATEPSLLAEVSREENKSPAFLMVEYSSPNTNKPLHLGHLRNILL